MAMTQDNVMTVISLVQGSFDAGWKAAAAYAAGDYSTEQEAELALVMRYSEALSELMSSVTITVDIPPEAFEAPRTQHILVDEDASASEETHRDSRPPWSPQ